MTNRKAVNLGLALALGVPALSISHENGGSTTLATVRPVQVRTHCSTADVAGQYFFGNLPGGAACPNVIPAACPPLNALPKLDAVWEIIGAYTPSAGGTNPNLIGEGLLGYFNFGATPGTLNCDANVPPTTACVITEAPAKDCVAVLRYDLRDINLSGVNAAALEVNGTNLALWNTLGANICSHRYERAGVDRTSLLLDFESADPIYNPEPVNVDCITTGRDFAGFLSFVQVHDVLVHEGLDNRGTEGGGSTHLTFRDRFPRLDFPLSREAAHYIKDGGAGGFVDIILRMADPRGALSEGPTVAAVLSGLPNANIFVAEDVNGVFLNNPQFSGTTNLVLRHDNDDNPLEIELP